MSADYFLGIDIGSTTLKMVLVDSDDTLVHTFYRRTRPAANGRTHCGGQCFRCGECYLGEVAETVDEFLAEAGTTRGCVLRTCVTGSQAVDALMDHLGSDAFISEVSAHVAGARVLFPDCRAVLDVGGQDSKAMLFDEAMGIWVSRISGVCAAGTGAFLDTVAAKLNVTVDRITDEADLRSSLELSSVCAVLGATSINKFKNRYPLAEILAAACRAQASTILSSVGGVFLGYRDTIVFQGGVAANGAVAHYLREISGNTIVIPEHHRVMGALGAAWLARQHLSPDRASGMPRRVGRPAKFHAWPCEPFSALADPRAGNRPSPSRVNGKPSWSPANWPPSRACALRTRLTIQEYFLRGPGPLVWRNLFYPAEILNALDVRILTRETYAAIQAHNKKKLSQCLARAAAKGFAAETCSFLRVLEGDPQVPRPDAIVSTLEPCWQGERIFSDLARELGRADRVFRVATPAQLSERAVETIASELEASVAHLEKTTGRTMDPARFAEACRLSNRARELARQCFEVRRSSPPLMRGSEALAFATVFSQLWGRKELVELHQTWLDELLERKALVERHTGIDDTHRLLWLHLAPFYSNALMNYVEVRCQAPIVFEEVNYVGWDELDPQDPYRSLARRMLTVGFLDPELRVQCIGDWAPAFKISGCVLYNHMFRRCSMADSSFVKHLQEKLQQVGIPLLVLDGDCIDETVDPCSTFTKVSAFVEALNLQKYGNPFGAHTRRNGPSLDESGSPWLATPLATP